MKPAPPGTPAKRGGWSPAISWGPRAAAHRSAPKTDAWRSRVDGLTRPAEPSLTTTRVSPKLASMLQIPFTKELYGRPRAVHSREQPERRDLRREPEHHGRQQRERHAGDRQQGGQAAEERAEAEDAVED